MIAVVLDNLDDIFFISIQLLLRVPSLGYHPNDTMGLILYNVLDSAASILM